MTISKRILAGAVAAPAVLAFAAPAHAQVSGAIATTDPLIIIAKTKAYDAANKAIETTFKSTEDQINARRTAASNELKPLIAQIDTNKDGDLSEDEVQRAQTAKSPALQKIVDAQNKANQDIQRMSLPVARAEGFAIENILTQYDAAQLRVVNARKIGVILKPSAFVYAPEAVDITDAIVAEIDKAAATVSIQPPQNWQPQQRTVSVQQALGEARQRAYQLAVLRQQQQQAQQQRAAQPGAAAPAQPAKKPEPR